MYSPTNALKHIECERCSLFSPKNPGNEEKKRGLLGHPYSSSHAKQQLPEGYSSRPTEHPGLARMVRPRKLCSLSRRTTPIMICVTRQDSRLSNPVVVCSASEAC